MPILRVRYNGDIYDVALRARDALASAAEQLRIADPSALCLQAENRHIPFQPGDQLPGEGQDPVLVLRPRTAGIQVRYGTTVAEVHAIPAGARITAGELLAAAAAQLGIGNPQGHVLAVVPRNAPPDAEPMLVAGAAVVPEPREPVELRDR